MQREALLVPDEITDAHLAAIQEVAAALRMTVNDFLNEDITGITLEQARKYLKAFASSADDSKILTAYYLVRATTDPSKK